MRYDTPELVCMGCSTPDLMRYMVFMLAISLSMKADSASKVDHNWQTTFWPCWGLNGVCVRAHDSPPLSPSTSTYP